MSELKEFKVDPHDSFPRTMDIVKEFLKANKKLNLVASTSAANNAARVAQSLKRLGYVEYGDIQTKTVVNDGKRETKLVITLNITPDFDKLYKEYEEEKEKKKKTQTTDK